MVIASFCKEETILIVVITIGFLLYWLVRNQSTPKDATTFARSEEERHAVRARMDQAAEERSQRSTTGNKSVCSSASSPPGSLKREPLEQNKQGGIRQASYIDEIQWKEEQSSLQTFGFDIYGNNTSPPCVCCAAPPSTTLSMGGTFGSGIHRISAIGHMPNAQGALSLLERLVDEFEPVVRARGWTVVQLSEMCCCGDGDEALPFQTSSLLWPANVMGYCVSNNNNRRAEAIHIRLRSSCGGSFYNYSELVQTMAHELAHIQVGPHNDAFYRVMKEILEERWTQPSNDASTIRMLQVAGRRLGGSHEIMGSRELRQRVSQAARGRQKNSSTTATGTTE